MPKVHTTITIGSRSQIAENLASISQRESQVIADGPDPDAPFTVVVLTDGAVEVFDRAEPK